MKYFFICSFFLLLIACNKSEFFPDPYNQGLSRFTSRDYNVASVYINDSAWVSDLHNWQSMSVSLNKTNNPITDTLIVSWIGSFDTSVYSTNWQSVVVFSIPVKKNFSKTDFFNWNGKLFPNDSTKQAKISFDSYSNFISNNLQRVGNGKIYFVKIVPESNGGVAISGLFEGNIGDSILIKKGRFDFLVDSHFGLQ